MPGVSPGVLSVQPQSGLQNSPYFCVFKYARAVKQKAWDEAENRERDWGETPDGRVRLARFARVRLLRHALPICLLILREKTDCFAVYLGETLHDICSTFGTQTSKYSTYSW